MGEEITHNLSETYGYAVRFIDCLLKAVKKRRDAVIVALYGDLGSGKTAFVKGVAKAFGVEQTVTSPTFVVEKVYKLSSQSFEHLIHIDAYRLEDSSELLHLGWNEIAENPKNIIFVEWADKVEDLLPDDTIKIHFAVTGEKLRKIDIKI